MRRLGLTAIAVVYAAATVLPSSCSKPGPQTVSLPPPPAAPLELQPPASDRAELAEPVEAELPESGSIAAADSSAAASEVPMDFHSPADDRLVRGVLAGWHRAGPARSGPGANTLKAGQRSPAPLPPPGTPTELGAQLTDATPAKGSALLKLMGLTENSAGGWSGTLADGRAVTVSTHRDEQGQLVWRIER